MMTDGDVSAPHHASDDVSASEANLAGHVAIGELLRVQALVPQRSLLARIVGVSPLSPETHAMYRGVVGEIEVGEALESLGADWVVLHALPVDAEAADIDHLLIGPAGVFIVSTKNHTGQTVWASQRTFMVAGVRYPHIRTLEYEMGRAERLLSTAVGQTVEVAGILAVVAPKSLTVRERHRDVMVLQSQHIVPWLGKLKEALSASEVRALAEAAARPDTWFHVENPLAEPESVRESFEQLRRHVRSSWRRQLGWAIAVTAIGVGTFAGLTYSILLNAVGSSGY
jgi:hypothetical protein